jgi:predicted phosphodiesterase
MKKLVFADFHLGTEPTGDQDELTKWLMDATDRHKPDSLIFNGDTFELILPLQHITNTAMEDKKLLLGQITSTWTDIFDYLKKSYVQEIIFINGEHDHEISQPGLEARLRETLKGKEVKVFDHYFDEESKTLIMHGHQLDYNRIFHVNGQKFSAIDGLTAALTRYLTQTQKIEQRIRDASRNNQFSYWYAGGSLPGYIESSAKLFGNDPRLYSREIAGVLKSEDIKGWLLQNKNLLTKILGTTARIVAKQPNLLLPLYSPLHSLLKIIINSRVKKILNGKRYTDEPSFLYGKEIHNLVLGHFHTSKRVRYGARTYFNIPSPRIHVPGLKKDYLQTERQLGYLGIDRRDLTFIVKPMEKNAIPTANYTQT